eukprot:781622-Pyramimonas_sp.AAC.1
MKVDGHGQHGQGVRDVPVPGVDGEAGGSGVKRETDEFTLGQIQELIILAGEDGAGDDVVKLFNEKLIAMHTAKRQKVRLPADPGLRSAFFIECVNANGRIRTLKEKVLASTATVFVAQEVGFDDKAPDDFVAWAGRRGWRCFASPGAVSSGATPTQ